MSRVLVEAYISGLALTEVAIVGAGKRCRIITGEIPPGQPIAHRYFFEPSHAELLLATIGQDGMSGRPAAVLADAIVQTAARLGAPFRSASEVRKAAELAVAEIAERIQLANQAGAMRQINKRYKAYRLQQLALGEMAIPYCKFVEEKYTMGIVRSIAAAAA